MKTGVLKPSFSLLACLKQGTGVRNFAMPLPGWDALQKHLSLPEEDRGTCTWAHLCLCMLTWWFWCEIQLLCRKLCTVIIRNVMGLIFPHSQCANVENSVLVLASCHSWKYSVRNYCSHQGFHKDLGFWSMTGTFWCQSSVSTRTFLLWKVKSGVYLVAHLKN